MEKQNFNSCSVEMPPKDFHSAILASSFVVEVGACSHVPLVVPFGSLEQVVRMALSAGMPVFIGLAYNSDLCLLRNEIQGALKSDE